MKVVSVSYAHALQLNKGESLPLKVWLPMQKREFVLSVDTSLVLEALSPGTNPKPSPGGAEK
jgi:hypothetical protein